MYSRFFRKWSKNLLCLRPFPPFSTLSTGSFPPGSSFMAEYLTKKCGLPAEKALRVSPLFGHINSPQNADSVLKFFQRSGFSDSQINELIARRPKFLLCNVERTLRPKFDFFRDAGFSGPEFADMVVKCPSVLLRRVDKHLNPLLQLLHTRLGGQENVRRAIKRCHWLLIENPHKVMLPKMELLRTYSISDEQIAKLFLKNPRLFIHKTLLERNITRLENWGVRCTPGTLIHAINSICTMSSATFEAKCGVLKSYGWSEAKIASAFEKTPYCLLASERKIGDMMNFFVKELGYNPTEVPARMFVFSLDKRLRPRMEVLKVLKTTGLLKKSVSLSRAMSVSDQTFFGSYVSPYKG